MKKGIYGWLVVMLIGSFGFVRGQGLSYPPFTKWYQNPLGFRPVSLHTASGLILPAGAALLGLLLTPNDPSLTNRVALFGEGGLSWGYFPPYTTLGQLNVGAQVQVRRWLSIGTELSVYHPDDAFNATWGVGLRPFFRFSAVSKPAYRLFFESGAGLILFREPFPQPTSGFGAFSEPRTGTRLNGAPRYGIGGELRLSARTALLAGVRHVHVSNGNNPGYERNPGHDSNGFYVGLTYRPAGSIRPAAETNRR